MADENTFSFNIPATAIPPLEDAQVNIKRAAPIAAGQGKNLQLLADANDELETLRTVKRHRPDIELDNTVLLESQVRQTAVAMAVASTRFPNAAMPAWAEQLVASNAQLVDSSARITLELNWLSARYENSWALDNDDEIVPLALPPGEELPPEFQFPQNREQLMVLEDPRLVTLLQAYHVSNAGTLAQRRIRLARHLGVRLPKLRNVQMMWPS